MKRVAFLGPMGTVSHESARYFFADEPCELIPYGLISDVFLASVTGETDYSVIPIENTIEGSVRVHMDWLIHEVDLPIRAEWVYPSVQNLIGYLPETADGSRSNGSGKKEKADFSRVRKVLSIDVAIAQCRQFLRQYLPQVEFEYVSSTAEGVRLVMERGDPSCAAIGTRLAAEMYGLDLLAENVADHENNYTRFVLIGKDMPDLREPDQRKTTILVTLPEDFPGALHQVLSAFAWRRINLSRIESRPTKKKLGSYYFYIDIEASMDSVLLPAALAEIEALGCQVRILGSYPSYDYVRVYESANERANSEV